MKKTKTRLHIKILIPAFELSPSGFLISPMVASYPAKWVNVLPRPHFLVFSESRALFFTRGVKGPSLGHSCSLKPISSCSPLALYLSIISHTIICWVLLPLLTQQSVGWMDCILRRSVWKSENCVICSFLGYGAVLNFATHPHSSVLDSWVEKVVGEGVKCLGVGSIYPDSSNLSK